jgi:hypothetical protein
MGNRLECNYKIKLNCSLLGGYVYFYILNVIQYGQDPTVLIPDPTLSVNGGTVDHT